MLEVAPWGFGDDEVDGNNDEHAEDVKLTSNLQNESSRADDLVVEKARAEERS